MHSSRASYGGARAPLAPAGADYCRRRPEQPDALAWIRGTRGPQLVGEWTTALCYADASCSRRRRADLRHDTSRRPGAERGPDHETS